MGKKNGSKKRKSGGAGGGFQVVAEGGSAAARATSKGELGGGGESDSDDDTAAIRKANAAAGAKRQKQADAKAAKAEGNKAAAGTLRAGKPAAKGGKAQEAAKTPATKGGKAVAGSVGKGKMQEASSGVERKAKGGRRAEEESEEEGEEGMEEEESSSEEELSDEGGDEDQGAGLLLKPGAYAEQRQGGRNEFEEDSGEGSDFEELEVVFDNMNPQEKDFHGIKVFVSELLDGEAFDSSALVDAMLEVTGKVGTVVKTEGAEDVFGIVSAVSLRSNAQEKWAKQLCKFMMSKCPADKRGKLEGVLSGSSGGHAGLVVSERMANMPQEMALPLMRCLFDEVAKYTKAKYDSFVFMSRYLVEGGGGNGGGEAGAGGKKKKGKGGATGGGGWGAIYVKSEDEVLRKHSSLNFDFALNRPSEDGLAWRGLCMIVPKKEVDAVLKGVLATVGDEAYRNQIK